jgi:hypothetical protein
MFEEVRRLPSKIVQVDQIPNSSNYVAWILCEDGSLWVKQPGDGMYCQRHPPHEPPTQAADLAEALEVVRNIIETDCEWYCPTEIEIRQAYEAAEALLKKHGINPQQDKHQNEDDDEDPVIPFTEEDLRK